MLSQHLFQYIICDLLFPHSSKGNMLVMTHSISIQSRIFISMNIVVAEAYKIENIMCTNLYCNNNS
jgi:hypothetical protein